ncbi:hypothetical protein CIRG_04781 [Coccidioides immitis RMSCC 2394]|uniref:Uncharacterized protein n=1 Tax=Coccidioides immitis RMSCC 2394 TaxID=404692 RepID=A0A0J6YBJ3_COCIT|nr:hypothetical protein CIRG_04781 [Coccidioides immitis RMSCC 2394]
MGVWIPQKPNTSYRERILEHFFKGSWITVYLPSGLPTESPPGHQQTMALIGSIPATPPCEKGRRKEEKRRQENKSQETLAIFLASAQPAMDFTMQIFMFIRTKELQSETQQTSRQYGKVKCELRESSIENVT